MIEDPGMVAVLIYAVGFLMGVACTLSGVNAAMRCEKGKENGIEADQDE